MVALLVFSFFRTHSLPLCHKFAWIGKAYSKRALCAGGAAVGTKNKVYRFISVFRAMPLCPKNLLTQKENEAKMLRHFLVNIFSIT
jgi:hypothetical protein